MITQKIADGLGEALIIKKESTKVFLTIPVNN
jgi:hypothetical protein